ncbi:hypothetical protein MIND_00568300 [Mycena indigotica]|uniref:Uncharacterized protein n=1 Tax=Mycena indigotica TaxID=2126181 RepID=A0A8H6W8Q9_9AGAR|nr:uncharacterized protein MIND_00568300 [Mycena indigotica]KAF7303399.1 hypothetical protein MIND_00568300 [Mycena indigotica]
MQHQLPAGFHATAYAPTYGAPQVGYGQPMQPNAPIYGSYPSQQPAMIPYIPPVESKTERRYRNSSATEGDSTSSVYGGSTTRDSYEDWTDDSDDDEETILYGGPRPRHHRRARVLAPDRGNARTPAPIARPKTPMIARMRTPVPAPRHAKRVADWVIDAQAQVDSHDYSRPSSRSGKHHSSSHSHGHSHSSHSHSHSKHGSHHHHDDKHSSSKDKHHESEKKHGKSSSHHSSSSHSKLKKDDKSHSSSTSAKTVWVPRPSTSAHVSRSLPGYTPQSAHVQVSYLNQPVAAPQMQHSMSMPIYQQPIYTQGQLYQQPQAYQQVQAYPQQQQQVAFAPEPPAYTTVARYSEEQD